MTQLSWAFAAIPRAVAAMVGTGLLAIFGTGTLRNELPHADEFLLVGFIAAVQLAFLSAVVLAIAYAPARWRCEPR